MHRIWAFSPNLSKQMGQLRCCSVLPCTCEPQSKKENVVQLLDHAYLNNDMGGNTPRTRTLDVGNAWHSVQSAGARLRCTILENINIRQSSSRYSDCPPPQRRGKTPFRLTGAVLANSVASRVVTTVLVLAYCQYNMVLACNPCPQRNTLRARLDIPSTKACALSNTSTNPRRN